MLISDAATGDAFASPREEKCEVAEHTGGVRANRFSTGSGLRLVKVHMCRLYTQRQSDVPVLLS